jgi:hypothetical protein
VVEKILCGDETIQDWPVYGTTGYDFIRMLNAFFINKDGLSNLERIYIQPPASASPSANSSTRKNGSHAGTVFQEPRPWDAICLIWQTGWFLLKPPRLLLK